MAKIKRERPKKIEKDPAQDQLKLIFQACSVAFLAIFLFFLRAVFPFDIGQIVSDKWRDFQSDVVVLDPKNFDEFISGKESMVEFYAPWCGHCKKLRPEYDLAASQLKAARVKLGKVDCDAQINKEICEKYEIEGFPTLKIFEKGEIKSDYSGPLEALAIVQKMLHIPRSEEIPANQEKMVKIVGKTFNEIVLESEKDVLVKFYAPWCPHCKNMAPAWIELANQNENENIVVGDIDVTANEIDFANYKDLVQGFPTVLLFKAGKKDVPIKYQGDRSLEDFKLFIASNLEK